MPWTQDQLNAYNARQLVRRGVYEAGESEDSLLAESDLHEQIASACKLRGWIALHGRMDMATGRTVGEPDFTILADNGRVIFVEAKTAKGKVKPEQLALHAWMAKLKHECHIVRSLEDFLNVIAL